MRERETGTGWAGWVVALAPMLCYAMSKWSECELFRFRWLVGLRVHWMRTAEFYLGMYVHYIQYIMDLCYAGRRLVLMDWLIDKVWFFYIPFLSLNTFFSYYTLLSVSLSLSLSLISLFFCFLLSRPTWLPTDRPRPWLMWCDVEFLFFISFLFFPFSFAMLS